MAKILVSGGLGLIGSYLTRRLLNLGHDVSIYDCKGHYAKSGDFAEAIHNRKPLIKGASVFYGDIRWRNKFIEVLKTVQPEIVIHLAAIPVFNPRPPYDELLFDYNLHGSNVVFEESAKTASVKRLVFASSSMAYGNFTKDPQPEESILNPIDRYGVTKAASELLLKQTFTQAGKEWVIIRPTSVYGFTDCNGRVVQKFVEAAIKNETIHATAGEALDFTYVKDVAEGFYLASITENVNDIYNISAGKSRYVLEVADIVRKYFPEVKVISQERENGDNRPVRGTMDITKAKEKLGYTPLYTLEAGIEEYMDYILTK